MNALDRKTFSEVGSKIPWGPHPPGDTGPGGKGEAGEEQIGSKAITDITKLHWMPIYPLARPDPSLQASLVLRTLGGGNPELNPL